MIEEITSKLYQNPVYLEYLRYHHKWYIALNRYPESYKDFEKEVKVKLKLTVSDKVENLRKQIEFINGMIKYLNSQ